MKSRTSVALAVAVVAIMGCSSGAGGTSPATDTDLELYSWWTNPGEADALDALLATYSKKHPQTNVTKSVVKDFTIAQQELQDRMIARQPPDTFQIVGGWNLLQWVVYNGEDDAESKMQTLDALAKDQNWANVIPKSVLDFVSYRGKLYGVPLGVHRTNLLFFNKKIFSEQGLNPPTTLAEFYSVSEALQQRNITPFSFGGKFGFTTSMLFLDDILIAQAGPEFRESYLAGLESPDDPRIVATLNELAKLISYADSASIDSTWDEAAQRVVDGTVAMTLIGDWAKGFFLAQGMHPDLDLGQVPAPGTEGNFAYFVDGFGLPLGATHRQAALNFMTVVGSAEAQDAFNPVKGSTPPRKDTDTTRYDSLAQKQIQDFQANRLIGAELITTPPDFKAELDSTMKQFVIDRDVNAVVQMLKNRYEELVTHHK